MSTSSRGFTIVELIVVIVVIAVLATISIVSYQGIQRRAYNTQLISVVKTYRDALLHYRTLGKGNGEEYPRLESGVDYGNCLGTGYALVGPAGSDYCWVGTGGYTKVNAGFDALLQEFIATKPTVKPPRTYAITANDDRQGAVFIRRNTTANARIEYLLDGANQSCGIAGAVASNVASSTATSCKLILPTDVPV